MKDMSLKNKLILNKIFQLAWLSFGVSSLLALIKIKVSQAGFYYASNDVNIQSWWGLVGSKLAITWLYWFGGAAYILIFSMIIYWLPKIFNFSWRLSLDRVFGVINLVFASLIFCQMYQIGSYGNLPGGGKLGVWLFSKFALPILIWKTLALGLMLSGLVLYSRLCFIEFAFYILRFLQLTCSPILQKTVNKVRFLKKWHQPVAPKNVNSNLQRSVLEHEYAEVLADLDQNVHQDLFWEYYFAKSSQEVMAAKLDVNNLQVDSKVESVEFNDPRNNVAKKTAKIVLPEIEPAPKTSTNEQKNVLDMLEQQSHVLVNKLKRFGVLGSVTAIKPGPVITLFEFMPAEDAKISRIIALENDLALALQTASLRIIAPVPGKPVVGFEVANQIRQSVMLSEVLQDKRFVKFVENIKKQQFEKLDFQIPIAIGKDTIGENVLIDLVKTPHLLVAGSTGSGKSVALNSILVSMLCANPPQRLRLILIDPKRLEFARYAEMGHLLFPIISDAKRTLLTLRWVVKEMERRYEQMARAGVRNMADYNVYLKNEQLQTSQNLELLPYIVIVIDELADLMMTAGKDVEDLIIRIAQMARAAGIHMIVATQRPSVDVVTGLIKVNFPSRISFRVASKADSRTILDSNGADTLLGSGDMLMLDAQSAALKRAHGAYVTDQQVNEVVKFILNNYPTNYLNLDDMQFACASENMLEEDALLGDVLSFLKECDEVSISLLQRRFRIGYNRSARIMDMLESYGYVLTLDNGKMRKVMKDRLD